MVTRADRGGSGSEWDTGSRVHGGVDPSLFLTRMKGGFSKWCDTDWGWTQDILKGRFGLGHPDRWSQNQTFVCRQCATSKDGAQN